MNDIVAVGSCHKMSGSDNIVRRENSSWKRCESPIGCVVVLEHLGGRGGYGGVLGPGGSSLFTSLTILSV